MTSFGHRFDFYDVIYHVYPCNIDIRWRNMIFTANGRAQGTLKIPVLV